MSKGPEYKLISETVALKVEQSVNMWTASGWQPLGGISVVVVDKGPGHVPSHQIIYSQALIKARQ
jgi:hypothetical protein